ncbi:MAG TPA: SDR family NAD(P)-dependent oxidoreductase [Thermoanaerobaculia bacterium]
MNLKGKTVVITGASSGIGRATALEMARRGADVVLAGRRAELLRNVAAECTRLGVTARVVTTDVSMPEQCRQLITTAGDVDVLVNNAGFAVLDLIEEASLADLREMMDTNYFGMVHCTMAALPGMLTRRTGTIVNVGSIIGIMGVARMGGYAGSKFAIAGFTEALRDEVMARGIRVSLVCPATTETEFFVRAERDKIPAASRLLPAVAVEKVARAICDAAERGTYRRIIPSLAAICMKMKELSPRLAHLLMRRISALLERR